MTAAQVTAWILAGTAGGAGFAAFARARRGVLAGGLVVAALLYVAFAAWHGAAADWWAIECGGVLVFGALAGGGWRSSPYWLAAGWGAHPLWDAGLHLAGPGAGIVAGAYVFACIGFDLLVAAYCLWIARR